jgi:hypothetical protein
MELTNEVSLKMFGLPAEALEELSSKVLSNNRREFMVASMLSDVQEMIAFGDDESARKLINVCKHLLFHMEEHRTSVRH